MLRPAPVWIALRYLRAQRNNQFAAIVALASVIGVALGVAALIVVLSVMNGFENELRARLVAMTGHAAVLTGREYPAWPELLADLRTFPGVVSAAPYIEVEALVAAGGELAGVVIEGVEPALKGKLPGLEAVFREASLSALTPGSWQALVGRSLALRLGVGPGDTLRVLVPFREPGGAVVARLRELTIAGVFSVGLQDQDGVRVLVSLADAGVLAGLNGRRTGIRLQCADLFAAPTVLKKWLQHWTANGRAAPVTTDWTRDNATYFRAVRIEKTMMTLLLSLIVAVAAFNIVATLVMVVTDKRPSIAILLTLGFSRRALVGMFALQGLLIGWAGVFMGLLGGALLATRIGSVAPALERVFGFEFMPADIYYLTSLPADLKMTDLLWVSFIALAMTAGATIYPALRAASVSPGEVLRYE